MTNSQGTVWETDTVNRANEREIPALRLVKTGQKDEADVFIGWDMFNPDAIGVVLWKRIVKRGGKNRQPLGERYVAVLTVDDFLDLVRAAGADVYAQNKWAEQISVTKTLYGLRRWLLTRLAD
jgi:hypothetical protein